MMLGDVEDDRTRLEQHQLAFFVGRNLAEGLALEMRGLLHRRERDGTNLIRLADFLERPTDAHVAREALAAVGRSLKHADGRNHRQLPWWLAWVSPRLTLTTNGRIGIRQAVQEISGPPAFGPSSPSSSSHFFSDILSGKPHL